MILRLKTKGLVFWDRIFIFFAFISLSNPLITAFFYDHGIKVNYQSVNIYIVFVLLVVAVFYVLHSKNMGIYWLILFLVTFFFIFSFVGFLFPVFERRGIIEFIGLYSNIAGAPLLSVFLIKYFKRNGQVDFFINIIFKAGILISIFNIYFFICYILVIIPIYTVTQTL